MIRGTSIALGIGLVVLWLVGLNNNAALWLTWLDGIAALCAFTIGASIVPEESSRATAAGAPFALAFGLFVLWAVGLFAHAEGWLAWWTFAFGSAFLALAVYGSTLTTPTRSITGPRTA